MPRPAQPPTRNVAPARRRPGSADHIAFSVLHALAARRLHPGARLTETNLGSVFGVSRTVVRQALTQLAAHGIVDVRPKKGWFITEPSHAEVADVFAARRLLEGALIREFTATATATQLRSLMDHVGREGAALGGDDTALRTHLLSDFHVRLGELTGNAVLVRMLRDLAMRTNLITMLYQTRRGATESSAEHADILAAIERRDADAAARLMQSHLLAIERGLSDRRTADPLGQLRDALLPGASAGGLAPPRSVPSPRRLSRPGRASRRTAQVKP